MKKWLILFAAPLLMSPTVLDEKEEALAVHNQAREAVGQAPLEWSNALERDAQVYANYLAQRDQGITHDRSNTKDGENIYMSYYHSVDDEENYLKSASESWLEEIHDYQYEKIPGRDFRKTGHYTQMIWSSTTKVGIAWAMSKTGKVYVVARYNPPGNMRGSYPY